MTDIKALAKKILELDDSCGCCTVKTTDQYLAEVESLLRETVDEAGKDAVKEFCKETILNSIHKAGEGGK